MKKMNWKYIAASVAIAAAAVLTGCGGTSSDGENTAKPTAEHPRKVLIGVRQDLFPTSYVDESGKITGYDIDMARKIDELLPQYEFEYEPVSQEALLTGLQSGKYAAAVAGFYDSKARREQYLFPKEPIGGNLIGLTVLKSNANLKNLEDIHDQHKTIAPIATTSGMYGIVVNYNNDHPDKQVELVNSDWTDIAVELKWITDGRYDALVSSKNVADQAWKKLGLQDQLVFNPFTAIKTYSLFNPKEQELADAYDGALKKLKEDGTASKISKTYFGEDVLPYISKSKE